MALRSVDALCSMKLLMFITAASISPREASKLLAMSTLPIGPSSRKVAWLHGPAHGPVLDPPLQFSPVVILNGQDTHAIRHALLSRTA